MDSAKTSGRLESLDVLRGFDMFFIFLADPVPCIVWTFLAIFGLQGSWFGLQFEHISGNGLRFYDCIFPLFLFISGVAFPFSYAKQRERGASAWQSSFKAIRRAVTLFVLGAMLWTIIDGTLEKNVLSMEWETFRVWSVIGRIGLAWGAAALFYIWFGKKSRIGIAIAILLAMWAVARFVAAPGAPDGVNPIANRQWFFSDWLDINFLTTARRPEGGLGTVTMIANAMLGMFAGDILRGKNAGGSLKVLQLLGYSSLLAIAGFAIAFGFGDYSFPINKSMWSSSFVLVTASISSALLAAFYWIVDVKGWKRWGFFFKVIGMNAITVYLLMRTVFNTPFALEYFFSGLYKIMPPLAADFLAQAGLIGIVWCFLLFLYNRKIFLRV
ncbi:MAG: DUF5009 domain-containing protein [Kiritimatiellae bacterium]|nr:DUF5009 domain-containing protein [Kiritimatiellia bacterium]